MVTTGVERQGLFQSQCPYVAQRPSAPVAWRSVGFVHWSYEPDAVARLLPRHVSVDLYGGRAWAGYRIMSVAPPGVGSRVANRIGHHEVQAVVQVIDRYGLPGLWYLSVDTSRSAVAALGRRWLNLSCYEADSEFATDGPNVSYRTRRPDGTTAGLHLAVGAATEATDVDRFLTARWRIVLPPRHWDSPTESRWIATAHEPWSLHRAAVEAVDDQVLVAAGLPPADSSPQALWSPGSTVAISAPHGEAQEAHPSTLPV